MHGLGRNRAAGFDPGYIVPTWIFPLIHRHLAGHPAAGGYPLGVCPSSGISADLLAAVSPYFGDQPEHTAHNLGFG